MGPLTGGWVVRCLDSNRADRRWLWATKNVPGWVLNTSYATVYEQLEDALAAGVEITAMLEAEGSGWIRDVSVVTRAEADAEAVRYSK